MKKFICGILCVAMLSGGLLVANADTGEAVVVGNAILAAKEIIDIPSEFKNVDTNTYFDEGEARVSITWSNADDSMYIMAVVNGKGELLNYNRYLEHEEKAFPKNEEKESIAIAGSFVKKVLGDYFNEMELVSCSYVRQSGEYVISFVQKLEGISVNYNSAVVTVDATNGSIRNYSGSPKSDFEINKEAMKAQIASAMDISEAEVSYINKIGPNITYRMINNWKDKSYKIMPTYVLLKNSTTAIDAVTGDIVNLGNEIMPKNSYAQESSADASMATGFTPEEQAAVDEVDGCISSQKAISIVEQAFDVKCQNKEEVSSSLGRRESLFENRYVWRIYTDCFNASVDAKTGEVLSYYYNGENSGNKLAINSMLDTNKAEQIVSDLCGDKINQCKKEYTELEDRGQRITYTRVVNDVLFENNSISVYIDKELNKITSYNMIWYDDVEFPSVEGVIKADKAFEVCSEYSEFGMQFVRLDNEPKLIYNFNGDSFYIDAFSGERLNSVGEKYSQKPDRYVDITGDKNEDAINQLLYIGCYISESQNFEPNKTITKNEFMRLASANTYTRDLVEGEDIKLTRYEFAKWIVEEMGYEEVAKKDIFIDSYKEEIPKEYRGYVAIAKSFGVLDVFGDVFEGEKYLTRSEAAGIIYYLLKNDVKL